MHWPCRQINKTTLTCALLSSTCSKWGTYWVLSVFLTNLLQVCDGLFQILGLFIFLLSNHLLLLLVQWPDDVGNFRVLVHVKCQVIQGRNGLIVAGYRTRWDNLMFSSVRSELVVRTQTAPQQSDPGGESPLWGITNKLWIFPLNGQKHCFWSTCG